MTARPPLLQDLLIAIAPIAGRQEELPQPDNYLLTDKLGESLQAAIYKGYHKHIPEYPLVVKFLKQVASSKDQERHLRQKIERLKVLHDLRVCTPLALESCHEQPFFVQPWFNGQPLNHWSEQHLIQPIVLSFFTERIGLPRDEYPAFSLLSRSVVQ